MAAGQRVLNPMMNGLLRSPAHGVVSGSLMLLTFPGRRSGHPYTIPVQYVADGDELLVYAGRAQEKTWWRNLIGGVEVTVRLRGHERAGTAEAITDPDAMLAGMRRYLERFPRTAKTLKLPTTAGGAPDEDALRRLAQHEVIVRIRLHPVV